MPTGTHSFFTDVTGRTSSMNSSLSPAMASFLLILLTGIAVMGLSRLLDHIWAQVLRGSWLYFLISAPGVIVHECAHITGCLLTGAKIKKVVLLSKEGGMVTYAPPAVPVIGNVIISTAPLFVLPLVLAALTLIFGTYAGCTFFPVIPSTDVVTLVHSMLVATGQTLYHNLFLNSNAWFLLYLYLVLSLALSFSPSTQDLKNAAAGIVIIVGVVVAALATGIPEIAQIVLTLCGLLGTGLTTGFTFELFAFVITIPFIVFYRKTV